MAMFARARYASEARQIECYNNLVRVKSTLLSALNEQQRLFAQYVTQSGELQNLDQLRETGRARVLAGLESAKKELRNLEREDRLADARAEAEMARLKFDAERYRKATADLTRPPDKGGSPRPTLADQLKQAGDDLDQINAAYEELRKREVEQAGGEENLSQNARDRLKQFEMLRDKLLTDALGSMLG